AAPHLATSVLFPSGFQHPRNFGDPACDCRGQCFRSSTSSDYSLSTPLPWSIWDAIVRDVHVSFPKLLASTEHAYGHADDRVEFAGGFVLAKNHKLAASQPIRRPQSRIGRECLALGKPVFSCFIPTGVGSSSRTDRLSSSCSAFSIAVEQRSSVT
ncbi:hypothetical protein DFH09DRAFT_1371712, partial [Mycena vulgaris]